MEIHHAPRPFGSPVTTVTTVPVIAAAPVGTVITRHSTQPFALQVTVQPLSPSSGRIRQAPPNRRVRSIDNLDLAAGAAGPEAPSHSPVPTEDQEPKTETKEESVFGEAAKSWARACSEMAKSSEEDFDNLQRQLNALFSDEKVVLAEDEPIQQPVKRFESW